MNLYHRTTYANAMTILIKGFQDGKEHCLTDDPVPGVWLSDRPLSANEWSEDDTVLLINIPEIIVAEYEWVGENKPYREFLAPASLVNTYGPPQVWKHEGSPPSAFPGRTMAIVIIKQGIQFELEVPNNVDPVEFQRHAQERGIHIPQDAKCWKIGPASADRLIEAKMFDRSFARRSNRHFSISPKDIRVIDFFRGQESAETYSPPHQEG